MFILCPHCQFLVAIEPASGLPPDRCPRCGQSLRADMPAIETPPRGEATPVPGGEDTTAPVAVVAVEAEANAAFRVAAASDEPAEATRPAAPDAPTEREKSGKRDKAEKKPQKAEKAEKPATKPGRHARDTSPEPAKPDKRTRRKEAGATAANDLPAPDASRPAHEPPAPAAPAADAVDPVHTLPPAPAAAVATAQGDDSAPPSGVAPATRRARAPSFAQTRASAVAARPRWASVAVIAGLALLLGLQLLLADRGPLAQDARWRPVLGAACSVLRCTLPAWHEPEAFALVARDVRPARPGVLHVTATFRNDARWTQAWPALHLALQDVEGRTIGARVFPPDAYRGARATQNGLAPGQVGSVAFDVAEPPGTVVAFTFDFR